MRGKMIYGLHSLPSANLLLMITGFSEFTSHGTQGLYHDQIEDLLGRGYDVLILDLPGHSSFNSLCFSNPEEYHQKLSELFEELYEANGKQRFKILAFSTAAAVVTHCWVNGAERFIRGVCFVNPAFEFKRPIFVKLVSILVLYYSMLLLSIFAGLIYWPCFIFFPVLYFGMRMLKRKKCDVRPDEVSHMIEKEPCYPLVASAKLILMQLAVKKSVKKHALSPVPILVLCGESDPFFTYRYVQHLFESDLRGQFLAIWEAGHSLLLTHWDEPRLQKAWNDFFKG